MKYIRTNEEIWDTNEIKVKEKNSRDLWEGYFIKDNCIYAKSRYWIIDEKYGVEYRRVAKIIKQANTIEELCDLVVYVKEGYDNSFETVKDFQKRNRKLFHKDLIVFGAIWTDKGLIYVAKMNEKGELELL